MITLYFDEGAPAALQALMRSDACRKMAKADVFAQRDAAEAEVYRLKSMIAGSHNGYIPAVRAINQEADLIREAGNDGRGFDYTTPHLPQTDNSMRDALSQRNAAVAESGRLRKALSDLIEGFEDGPVEFSYALKTAKSVLASTPNADTGVEPPTVRSTPNAE